MSTHYVTNPGSKGLAVVLNEENYEDLELWYPKLRLVEAGFDTKLVGPKKGQTHKSKNGYWATSDLAFNEVNAAEVKVIVIPGGWCPDRLRRYPECNNLVADVWKAGGVVAFICHGAWVPISAKILKGHRVTSFSAVRDDCENAGATWLDERVVVDGKMVSAQLPDDLPAFMKAILSVVG
eukprot:TRINITY_DN14607_c0_g1_i1.p1 TRINITY_DN14607_c0_g1~~TRINITY_DN14607_c0_g1_i1.p1  ORF type:complete len:199 (+),score=4.03 TRINITY_DN14607_c0_g1_i1:59-598(+)